jgi:hypothetical protein
MLWLPLAQNPGELSISSWGYYAPVTTGRNLGGAPGSVDCHLTDRDIAAHKAPFMTGHSNANKH